jgi:hypothetical protein
MQSTDVQSEDAIDVFCITAEFFGEIYRRYLSKNGTHKLHLLELHVGEMLRRHKRLGLFDESQVERGHHTNKVYCLLFRNMKNWFKMHDAIQRRCYTSQVPAVQAATSSMLSDTKRMRCEASVVATEEKKAVKRQVKEEKRVQTSSAAVRRKSIG